MIALRDKWELGCRRAAGGQRGLVLAAALATVALPATAAPQGDFENHVILLYGIGDDNSAPPVTSGVALAPSLIIAPAGKLKDAQRVLIGRGDDAKVFKARHVSSGGQDFIVVSVGPGGSLPVTAAPLAKADPDAEFSFTAATAKPGGIDTTTGSGKPGAKPVIHSIDALSPRGAALFDSCGNVLGVASGPGKAVLAGELAAALAKAHIAVTPAAAVCANDDAGYRAGLVQDAQRAVVEANNHVSTATNRAAALLKAKDALLKAKKAADASHRQLLIYLAIGGGAAVLLGIALAAWLWSRSRRLARELNDAKGAIKKTRAAWNDCVLEGGAGTLKLSGLRLANGGVIVGRSRQEADVLLDKEDISRKHARFEVVDDAVEVTDLGSMNKTQVNETPLDNGRSRRLYDGDWVMLASNRFQFKILQRRN